MDIDQYARLADRVANRTEEDTDDWRLTNFSLGLAGESGEVCDLIKKALFHGHGLHAEKIKEELGDVLWYVAMIATTMGMSLNEIAEENIAKLSRRYPNGFDKSKSVNRQR